MIKKKKRRSGDIRLCAGALRANFWLKDFFLPHSPHKDYFSISFYHIPQHHSAERPSRSSAVKHRIFFRIFLMYFYHIPQHHSAETLLLQRCKTPARRVCLQHATVQRPQLTLFSHAVPYPPAPPLALPALLSRTAAPSYAQQRKRPQSLCS